MTSPAPADEIHAQHRARLARLEQIRRELAVRWDLMDEQIKAYARLQQEESELEQHIEDDTELRRKVRGT